MEFTHLERETITTKAKYCFVNEIRKRQSDNIEIIVHFLKKLGYILVLLESEIMVCKEP